jgi:hypothetical protein
MVNWITSDFFLNTIGVIAILELCVLLIVKEFIRTTGYTWAHTWMRGLDYVIFPLLLVFGLTGIGRLLSLLGYG